MFREKGQPTPEEIRPKKKRELEPGIQEILGAEEVFKMS